MPNGVHIRTLLPKYEKENDDYDYHDEEPASDIHSHLPVSGLHVPARLRSETAERTRDPIRRQRFDLGLTRPGAPVGRQTSAARRQVR